MDATEFFEQLNLADEIALKQQEAMKIIPDFDIRPNTFGNLMCNLLGQTSYDVRQMALFILQNLSPNTADSYGLRNIICPLFGLTPNNGTKTQQYLDLEITEPTTLYAEKQADGINNYTCQVMDNNSTIYQIVETQTFSQPGTYKVLFETQQIGEITSRLNTINIIINKTKGLKSANNNEKPVSIGSEMESDYDIRKKLLKTTPIIQSNNLIQGLEKQLLNAGCKDVKVYLSTIENQLQEKYDIPVGYTYIICNGGDSNDIFNVLFNQCLGANLYGEQQKTETINGFGYTCCFDYVSFENIYCKFILKVPRGTLNIEQYITNLKDITAREYKSKYMEENNQIINTGNINNIISQGLIELDNKNIYNENTKIGLTLEDINYSVLQPTKLKNIFELKKENIIIDIEYYG